MKNESFNEPFAVKFNPQITSTKAQLILVRTGLIIHLRKQVYIQIGYYRSLYYQAELYRGEQGRYKPIKC